MKTYAERNVFSYSAIELWAFATDLIERIPDTYGNEVRCHELARAVWQVLGRAQAMTTVVDGKFGMIEHTWLRGLAPSAFILDVYMPGAVPQVVLVDGWNLHPIGGLYTPSQRRNDIRQDMIDKLVAHMKEPT
jgi:hypothetical protein